MGKWLRTLFNSTFLLRCASPSSSFPFLLWCVEAKEEEWGKKWKIMYHLVLCVEWANMLTCRFLVGHTCLVCIMYTLPDILEPLRFYSQGLTHNFVLRISPNHKGDPPMKSSYRMAHNLANFYNPYLNPWEIHVSLLHQTVGTQACLTTAFLNLSAVAPINTLHSELWWEAGTCPQRDGWGGGPNISVKKYCLTSLFQLKWHLVRVD